LACAALVQPLGWNDTSHYAQTRAFDAGTPIIDAYAESTGDRGVFRGHFYSDKAPGLSLLGVPFYRLARATGVTAGTDDRHVIHLLVVFTCLVPGALLLWLLATFAEGHEPGRGTAAAMMLGLGSLLLPFSTLYFSHVLAAGLGFAAYHLLWRERRGEDRALLLFGAGVLAGLAVTTEYPLAILALILGVYALARPDPLPRALRYGAGLLVGVAPLLLYNWWAFGSPAHVSYSDVALNQAGFFGLVGFHPRVLLELLFGDRGLVTLTPIVAVGVAGLVFLYREGRRAEALMAGGVGLAYLVFNASYYLSFGGWTPGPRFLIVALPFLALPLAVSLRRLPALTVVLALVSAAVMIAATLTLPELPDFFRTTVWWERLRQGEFANPGADAAVAWFAVFVAASVVLTARLTRVRITRAQLELAAAGLAAWVVLARAGPNLLAGHLVTGEVALVVLVAGVAATGSLWARRDILVLLAGALLAAFALHAVNRHYGWALIIGVASLGLTATAHLRRRRPGAPALQRA
jgi:hypothetical protein